MEPSTNPWSPYTGDMLLIHTLSIWADFDQFLANVSLALYELDIAGTGAPVKSMLHSVVEGYVAYHRNELLQAHYVQAFGGIENVSPQDIETIMIPLDEARMLNVVMAFYKIPRAFAHLYHHAHLLHYLDEFRDTNYSWLAQKSLGLLVSLYEGVETAPDTK